MSKFVDKLANLNKSVISPLGFGRFSTQKKNETMLVMVELEGKRDDEIRAVAEVGVVAGLVKGLTPDELTQMTMVGLSVGLVLDSNAQVGIEIHSSEIDFVVFRPELSLSALEGWPLEQTGKVIELNPLADAGLIRSVNNLYPGVDAVIVDLTASPLTVEHMMSCRRIADFSGQPIIARTSNFLSTVELVALREAGVKCLLLGAGTSAGEAKALVEAIRTLPSPSPKKGPKDVAILPIAAMGQEREEGSGDGDEDNDDN